MTPQTAADKVLSLLGEVKRDGIDNLINFIKESDYLTDATCHSHHKNRYGLMFHSLEVLDVMLGSEGKPYSRESLILVALCHDVGKATLNGNKVGRGRHPQRAVAIIKKCGLKLTDMELDAIRYHHPHTDRAKKSAFSNPLQRLLHKGDCLSTGLNKIGLKYRYTNL